jgi:hypothetical protein
MDNLYASFGSSGTVRDGYTASVRRIALTALSLATVAASGTFAQQPAADKVFAIRNVNS